MDKVDHSELRDLIYRQLVRANAKLPGVGKSKFSKDLAKMIQKYLAEKESNQKS